MGEVVVSDLSAERGEANSGVELADESTFGTVALSTANGITIKSLPSGCIYSIECGNILVSQVLASPLGGGIHRIYLRIRGLDGISFAEIVGPGAAGEFSATKERFHWTGVWRDLHYRCTCLLARGGDSWFFQVEVENRSGRVVRCDAVMVQDLGLATRAQSRNNERYTSQYLDHFAMADPQAGYLLMTRQNLPQPDDTHPWLLQGCFPRAAGFTTDGFDFFGLNFKSDGIPAALSREILGTRIRQYEAGYTAIQSAAIELAPGASGECVFFSKYVADHPEPSSAAELDGGTLENLRRLWKGVTAAPVHSVKGLATKGARSIFQTAALYFAENLEEIDIRRLFPGPLRHEEFEGAQRLSFFLGAESRHVVLKAKELASARPHGHIMRSGRGHTPDAELMSCTFYAAGIFGSQMTLGNTVFGKFLSGVRDPLNIIRSTGLRMFVRYRSSQRWQLLAVPSAFEMGLNFCRWYYKGDGNLLTVTCAASDEDAAFTFCVQSEQRPVELMICGEIAAGPQEYDSSPRLSIDARQSRITVRPDPSSMLAGQQPSIVFHAVSSTPQAIEKIGDDELIAPDRSSSRPLPYFAIRSRPTQSFALSFVGAIEAGDSAEALCAKYETLDAESLGKTVPAGKFWKEMGSRVRISSASSPKAGQIQDVLTWFARDAVIHHSVPRGLEQANGGAWGVRDVCQGPVEFLLSYDHADLVKNVLRELFSQQYFQRGDWPQWFMFPPFQQVQSSSCHGDILIWPLKALCDYLEHTGDGEILQHRLPYTEDKTFQRTERFETVLQHVDRLLEALKRQFLPGVSFPRYGEGDWDDSLQPKCRRLGERMVSSWTTALAYQTLSRYGEALGQFGLHERAETVLQTASQIQRDFQRYLVPDGVVAGFAVFGAESSGLPEYLLHPSDTKTGLRYRLISMTRGVISGIFSAEQAARHLELVKKHLVFPDGARLMDRPTRYDGGRESMFRRSESAAFFGREIGLQYVHAHLRYAEALAAMGHSEDLLRALCVVNPIAVTSLVKNAGLRQRNCYFSSSDAAFDDRYDASRNYDKLRDGEVAVDGGWRIYSSGPGIYTNLVVRHLLGLRRWFDFMEFDPILPRELDGVICETSQFGRKVRYLFKVAAEGGSISQIAVNGSEFSPAARAANPYRRGGIRIRKSEFEAALTLPENVVQIELG